MALYNQELFNKSMEEVGKQSHLESRRSRSDHNLHGDKTDFVENDYTDKTSLQFQNQAVVQGFRGQSSEKAKAKKLSESINSNFEISHNFMHNQKSRGENQSVDEHELKIQNQLRIQTQNYLNFLSQ